MQNKNFKIYYLIVFVLLGLLFFITPCYSKTYKIYDIDIIDITGIDYESDILRVQFQYINRDKGTWVRWEKKNVDCSCQVFFMTNDQKKKQRPIASVRNFLEKYDQLLFIDVPENLVKDYEYGHIECEFNIGWKLIKTDGNFKFR